jgi:hypothetical protein
MARAAVRIGVRELAETSGVAESTILRFEGGEGDMLRLQLRAAPPGPVGRP